MPSAAARQRKKDERESASYEEEARAEADKAKEQGNSIAYIVLICDAALFAYGCSQAFLQPKNIKKTWPNLLRGQLSEPDVDVLADDDDSKDKLKISENWPEMLDGHAGALLFVLMMMSLAAREWSGMKKPFMSVTGLLLLGLAGATTLDPKTFEKPPMSFIAPVVLAVFGIANLAGASSYSELLGGKMDILNNEVPLAKKLLLLDTIILAGLEYARWVLGGGMHATGPICQVASAGRLMLGVHLVGAAFSTDQSAVRGSLLAILIVSFQAIIAALIFYTWSLAGVAIAALSVIFALHLHTLSQPPLINPFQKWWRQTVKTLFSSGISGYGDD